jgi:hypothetical protein
LQRIQETRRFHCNGYRRPGVSIATDTGDQAFPRQRIQETRRFHCNGYRRPGVSIATDTGDQAFPLQRIQETRRFRGNGYRRRMDQLFGVVAYIRFSLASKREFIREFNSIIRVEAGSNTSTVTLRVVGGDEKGSLKSETVKYGRASQGTRTPEWMRWLYPAATVNHKPLHTSDRERPTSTNPQLPDGNKNVFVSPRWVIYSKIDWPTDCRS